MSQNSVDQQVKDVLKSEGLSWEKVAELTGEKDRSNARRNLLGWLGKANTFLNHIGYRIAIVPINEDKESLKK